MTHDIASRFAIHYLPARDIQRGDRLVTADFAGPAITSAEAVDSFGTPAVTIRTVNGGRRSFARDRFVRVARPDVSLLAMVHGWSVPSVQL